MTEVGLGASKPPTMKASAWNKSRVIPPITNFLVLMFSIMAPAMAKERLGAGERKKMSHRARSRQ